MKAFVTGSSGFVGRHLVARLETDGWEVARYDRRDGNNVMNMLALTPAMRGANVVFHLAALADVRDALKHPRDQVEQNLYLTLNVLEAMRQNDIKRIAFTSSAVVYGDCLDSPITERGTCFPKQTSVYGAMKLASESLIAAYCKGHGYRADVVRTVSLVGAGYRHGNLRDFYDKLRYDPETIEILGTGRQQKYYVDVHDLVDALLMTVASDHEWLELWNVSHDMPNTINDAVDAVCRGVGVEPKRVYIGDPWAGDLPGLVLDCSKLRALGWAPKVSIRDGMDATVKDFIESGI